MQLMYVFRVYEEHNKRIRIYSKIDVAFRIFANNSIPGICLQTVLFECNKSKAYSEHLLNVSR